MLVLFCIAVVLSDVSGEAPDVYWNMNEAPDNVLTPQIPQTGEFTYNLNETTGIDYVTGYYDGSIKLNGTFLQLGNYKDFNKTCLAQPWDCQGFTFASWVYVYVTNKGFTECILRSDIFCQDSSPGVYLNLKDNKLNAGVRLTNGQKFSAAAKSFSTKNWTHIALSWAPDTGIKIYVNGIEANYVTKPKVESLPQQTHFFKFIIIGGNYKLFVVGFDDVKIWNKAISHTEVKNSMNEGEVPTTTISEAISTNSIMTTSTKAAMTTSTKAAMTTSTKAAISTSTKATMTTSTTTTKTKTTNATATTSGAANNQGFLILLVVCILFLILVFVMIFLLARKRRKQTVQLNAVYRDIPTSSANISEL